MPMKTSFDLYVELVNSGFFSKEPQRRPFIESVIKELDKVLNEGFSYLLVAPPGIGKTAIPITYSIASLLRSDCDVLRVIHTLPLRSLADDIKKRFKEGLSRLGIKGEVPVAIQYGFKHESPYFMASYVLSTIDMYVINLLKVPTEELHKLRGNYEYELFGHYEISRASILSALNVFDEAHLILEGEGRGWSTIMSILKYLVEVRVPFIIMTATLPNELINQIKKYLGNSVIVKKYEPFEHDDFYKQEIKKSFIRLGDGVTKVSDNEKLLEIIDDCLSYGKLAVVVNTVKLANSLYQELRKRSYTLLIHSRFTLRDREEKVKALENRELIISTQVIEVGIDASFNVLLSELAPMSSIIQRFGRLARHNEDEGYWLVFYDEKRLGSSIYDRELCRASLEVLKGIHRIHWHLPRLLEGTDAIGYEVLLNRSWSIANVHFLRGYDLSCLRILKDPFISSRDVISYLSMVGTLVREGAYLPIYVGEPPNDYINLLKSVNDSLIPSNINFTFNYLSKAYLNGYDVGVITLSNRGNLDIIDFQSFLMRLGINLSRVKGHFDITDPRSMYRSRLLREIVSGSILAAKVPKELYEGGVDGSGIKML